MEVLGGEVVLEVDGFVVVLEAEFTCVCMVLPRTYPKLSKKWSAESEANGLSCEAAREKFSAGFSKTVH